MIPALLQPLLLQTDIQGGSSSAMEWVNFAIRWLHVWLGIVWLGHLYFFNFVNANTMPKLDGPTKKMVVPQLMPRALFWFRWGAAITWITGILLFGLVYFHQKAFFQTTVDAGNILQGGSKTISPRGIWMLLGVVFGTVMAFNVWFVIWPRQKAIIPATRDGKAGEPEIQAMVKTATAASKLNTYLSVPMLASMISSHFPSILYGSVNMALITMLILTLIGFALVWHVYKVAAKVSGM
ncbi:MAG: urate hydroxylase PuuD [Planctomycetota bacterium]